jgi:hypothetical protein
MKPGDIVLAQLTEGSEPVEVTIIDDCFRLTEDLCTALVRLNEDPSVELEVNVTNLFLENHSG